MIYKDFIFIHIPKTGGSSIRSSLDLHYKLIYNASENNFKKLGCENKKFENYNFLNYSFKDHLPYQLINNEFKYSKFKFTFTRNPFSRIVSLYFECKSTDLHLNELSINRNISFEDFLNLLITKQYWFTIPMIDFIGKKI